MYSSRLRILGLVIALVSLGRGPSSVWAQAPSDTVGANRQTAPTTISPWAGEVLVRGVSAESVTRDEEELNGSGYVLRGRVGYRADVGLGRINLRGGSTYYGYAESDRDNRWSNELLAELQRPLTERVLLDLTAGATTNLATLEYPSADQLSTLTQVTYQPNRDHRFRVYAAYRFRFYGDGAGSGAHAPYAGASYRNRMGRYQYIDLGTRYEWVDAEVDRRDYRRAIATAFYTHPTSRRSRLRLGAIGRAWNYPNRLLETDEVRRDWSISPQATYTYDFRSPLRVEMELRWTERSSNAPGLDRSGHRAALALRYEL